MPQLIGDHDTVVNTVKNSVEFVQILLSFSLTHWYYRHVNLHLSSGIDIAYKINVSLL